MNIQDSWLDRWEKISDSLPSIWRAERNLYARPIVDFCEELLADRDCRSLLDPHVSTGLLGLMAADRLGISCQGVVRDQGIFQALSEQALPENTTIQNAAPIHFLQNNSVVFDGIVSWSAFSGRAEKLAIGNTTLSGSADAILALFACKALAANGLAFFVVPPSFHSKQNRKVIEYFETQNIFIDALIYLRHAGAAVGSSISGYLAILSHHDNGNLFVGELTDNSSANTVLAGNYLNRKSGATPELGFITNRASFVSYPALLSQHRAEVLARRAGLENVRLVDVITAVNLPKRDVDPPFDEQADVVYLPSLGTSRAVTTLGDATVKPQNLFQIELDSNKVNPRYLAGFFNSPLGRMTRKSMQSGSTIPKISKATLQAATIYLPPKTIQDQVAGIDVELADLTSELDGIQQRLWDFPNAAPTIAERLEKVNREDSFDAWVEELPFPLASILWSYHAESDPKSKVEMCLNFFEALAEFISTILLTGFSQSPEALKIVQETIETQPNWIKTTTFGSWIIVGERLAKQLRTANSSKDRADEYRILQEAFGNPQERFESLITSKKLFALLKKGNTYRQRWKGHGGYTATTEANQQLQELDALLSELRTLLTGALNSCEFLVPMPLEYEDGLYVGNCYSLVGTRTPFRHVPVKSLVPMEKGDIHVLHEGQNRPMRLLPLVRLGSSPDTQKNACYFYNRIDGGNARYVSYQYSDRSEDYVPANALQPVFELLGLVD